MSTNNLKNTTILSFVLLFFGFFSSCTNDSQATTNDVKTEVAQLVQRGEKIQLDKEWEDVQNKYQEYKKKLKDNPNDNKTKIQLAQLYIKEARVTGEHGHYYPAALAVIDDALNNKELTEDMKFLALMTKAGVQLSLHDFKDALDTGNEAALMNPTNAQIHGVLIDANVELGNYKKAVALSDRMLAIKPDIRSYSRASYLREIHGDVEGCKDAMKLAVKAGYPGNEDTAWAMLTLGDIYKNYGALDTAEMIYKNILEMRPNYPFAVGALGDIYLDLNNDIKAEETLKQAMDIIPEVGFYISLAHLYKKQNKQEELKSLVDEIMIMLKEDTDSGHNMNLEYADLYLTLLDDNEKALLYAEKEYKKRPENIDVNLMMAKVLIKDGKKDEAKPFVEIAMSTNSKKPDLLAINKSVKM